MPASPSVAPSFLLSLTASASGASMEVGATLPISRDTRRKLTLHARGHCPFSRVDGHCRGDIVRDSPDIRVVAEMGGTRQRCPTCYVWAAMAISFGLKSPLDYSVFSASGAALLLALRAYGRAG